MYICVLKFRYGVPCVEMLQKRAPDPPKLELYAVVRLLMWMKGAEGSYSGRAASTLTLNQ